VSGLKLKDKAIVPQTKGQESLVGFTAQEIMDEVSARTHELGLPAYPRPTNTPVPLTDVDVETLTNHQLGALYTQYTAFAQFVNGQLAEAEAGYKIASSRLKMLDARLRAELFAQNVPKTEVPVRVKENGALQDAEFELVKLFAMKTILEAHYKAYDKQASALSRIITLRELEFEKEMRDNGIHGRKPRARTAQRPGRDFARED
jgi:hypothetical protein